MVSRKKEDCSDYFAQKFHTEYGVTFRFQVKGAASTLSAGRENAVAQPLHETVQRGGYRCTIEGDAVPGLQTDPGGAGGLYQVEQPLVLHQYDNVAYHAGKRVTVVYDPKNPALAMLADEIPRSLVWSSALAIDLVLLIVVSWALLRRS